MITIGLTGGIGSGKSTVSFMLKEAGFEIIDADIIARDVLKKYPEILERVKVEFGAGFFDWRGEFRRKEFGNHIFRFPKQRKKYEEIIIPYIKREIFESMDKHKKNGNQLLYFHISPPVSKRAGHPPLPGAGADILSKRFYLAGAV